MGDAFAPGQRWLRVGITETVALGHSPDAAEAIRQHWRATIRKDHPADPDFLLGSVPSTSPLAQRRLRADSLSLINFLSDWGGRLNFAYLLAQLRAGKPIDEAIDRAYPGKLRSFDELYRFWLENEIGEIKTPAPTRK
jgi:hypothetical protein